MIGQVVVHHDGGAAAVRSAALFGMLSLIPYLGYLLSIYLTVERLGLLKSLLLAVVIWSVIAALLVWLWQQ